MLGKIKGEKVNANICAALESARMRGKTLIAAHRGTAAGAIFPNTARAAKAALVNGADLVELDVARSKDGKYFTFHDTYEPFLLNEQRNIAEMDSSEIAELTYYGLQGPAGEKVETYAQTLQQLPQTLINVDRSYFYWQHGFLNELAKWADPQYLLIKSDPTDEYLSAVAECATPFPYMAVVHSLQDIDKALEAAENGKIRLVALEIVTKNADDPMLDKSYIRSLLDRGLSIWLNALSLENGKVLCGGFDDVGALFDHPENHWGKLVDLGATVIQTDWPAMLRQYLANRSSSC